MMRAFAVVERFSILAEVLHSLKVLFQDRILVHDKEGVERDIECEECYSWYFCQGCLQLGLGGFD